MPVDAADSTGGPVIAAPLGVSREQARKWVVAGEKFCREWLRLAGRQPDA